MLTSQVQRRAEAVAQAGTVRAAIDAGHIEATASVSVAEALVLGLLEQGVRTYFVVLGHGSTELAERLRCYAEAGAIKVVTCRNEVEAAHAAMALRWTTGAPAAVVTSIGPGAMQAAAASLAAASDGVGVYHIYGDETTFDEGPNMQQVPAPAQHSYLKLLSHLGSAYSLHTAEAIVPALRRASIVVNHPYREQPFFLLLPINVQPEILHDFRLERLPERIDRTIAAVAPVHGYAEAASVLMDGRRVAIKVGRGASGCGDLLMELADLIDAVFVMSPSSLGIVPSSASRQMTVGGSKGSISGNYAMEHADTLLVVGSRGVCQSDCSRTGYPNVRRVVNINANVDDVSRYSGTTALLGDTRPVLERLVAQVRSRQETAPDPSEWFASCRRKRSEWDGFKAELAMHPRLHDEVWGREVLTQPVAIHETLAWVRSHGHTVFFDAGDVQANGFQLAEVDEEGWFFTESGASYMGFATSAILAGGVAADPFYGVALTGDGSFVMNPQALIDAVHTRTRGAVVLLDNRRMAAISSLQAEQYGADFATADGVEVDYVQWASSIAGVLGVFGGTSREELRAAFDRADAFDGVTLIHVPVYFGPSRWGGMGSYGRWNVGGWVDEVQALIEKTVI